MKILILVAHPDDEIIMCGATIDKLIKKGHEVFVTFYTQNCQGYFYKETQVKRKKRALKEANKSAHILEYKINFLPFHDMEVGKNEGVLLQQTIKEIRRINPDVIFTHYSQDKHIDHRTIGKIVPEANFQSGCAVVGGNTKARAPLLLQGEVDLEMTTPFDYSVVSLLTKENINRKIEAFNSYTSVKDEHSMNQDWIERRLRSVASIRGASINGEYGEAFIINNYSPLTSTALKIASEIM
ncbi:MAG: hypothetical protein E6Q58_03325 [Niabella sp.]|nr:MAG: hypothetical protein E6Q58_03325 [Niabella sp.]